MRKPNLMTLAGIICMAAMVAGTHCEVRGETTTHELVESYLAQDMLETIGAADVPAEIQSAAAKYGAEYQIAPEFVVAVIWRESRFQVNAKARGCLGLMQINTSAHRERMERLGVSDIWDIDGNIHVGCDYLSELFEAYEDPGIVLLHYNGAKTAIKEQRMTPYATQILEVAAAYERTAGK